MGSAELERVGVLRDLYRLRYREPCLLPGHEVLALYRKALSRDWVQDLDRATLRLMRRADTGFDA